LAKFSSRQKEIQREKKGSKISKEIITKKTKIKISTVVIKKILPKK
jgi:hypothetical protein